MATARSPEEINIRFGEALNRGDIPALLDLYEPDAVVVPRPDAAPVSGLAAIETTLRSLAALGGTISFEPRYWLQHGDLAMGSINFHLTGGTDSDGNPVELRASTAEVARRQPDGTWRYVFDHPFGAGEP